jgi:carboxypeptidase C (cathepsin A)
VKDHDEAGVREDMYYFVQAFLQAHPQYQRNEFFVFGESYGGHYAPNTAWRIVDGNNNLEDGFVHVNLAGLGVGNGLTQPSVQYEYYAQMAYNFSLARTGKAAISLGAYVDKGGRERKKGREEERKRNTGEMRREEMRRDETR